MYTTVFTPLSTERLQIKKLDLSQKDAFFRYRSLSEVFEYQSFRPNEPKEAETFIIRLADSPNVANTWFQLAVCIKENGRLIGDIGLHFMEDEALVEIGYTLAPDFQGQGYATEAMKAVFGYLFSGLHKHRIAASVDADNTSSIRLLERLGMRKEAHFVKSFYMDGVWSDDCIYAILNEEWIVSHV